jgi:phosphoribosylanthranilate isomerase
MWIKICGNTNLRDAQLAVEAGADALGFVFAPSPRQVTDAQARRITVELPPQIEKYGVFVDAPFAGIAAAVDTAGLTGVQLHSSKEHAGEADLPARLEDHFAGLGQPLHIVRVINLPARGLQNRPELQGDDLDRALSEASRDSAVHAVIVDSSTAAALGGTGSSFDWAAAQGSFLRAAPDLRIIVAGGLRPENVEQAVLKLRPWGVDVVSGVESVPGKKDPARLCPGGARNRDRREQDAGLRNGPPELGDKR